MHPGVRGICRHELEAQRAHAPLAALGQRVELRARHPQRRMRLLIRLRQHVAQRHVEVLAVMLGAAILEHRDDGLHGLFEDLALVLHRHAERLELGRRCAFAHAELATAARQQVEAGDTLGDARGMIRRDLVNAVAEPDLLGALARGREERFGRRRMRIFFEEVMLDFPRIVVAELVGEFDLAQRVLIKPVFVALFPGARQLQLIKYAEFHLELSPTDLILD